MPVGRAQARTCYLNELGSTPAGWLCLGLRPHGQHEGSDKGFMFYQQPTMAHKTYYSNRPNRIYTPAPSASPLDLPIP